MSNDSDKHKAARGALPWQAGDEQAEATIRRIRGGDTERIAALEAENEKLKTALRSLRVKNHSSQCYHAWQVTPPGKWRCTCGLEERNGIIMEALDL
jgi:hypothetical protein